ncbi:MAG TPA: hypothetical protein VFI84_04505 [Candidatus Saccharimonadales bacterium]|nr:hypothetical protein [Candidatus Saccharimonadales bacterium]
MTYEEMTPAGRACFDATHDPDFTNWGQEDWVEKEKRAELLLPPQRVAPIRTLATPQEIALELRGVPQSVAKRLAHEAISGFAQAS